MSGPLRPAAVLFVLSFRNCTVSIMTLHSYQTKAQNTMHPVSVLSEYSLPSQTMQPVV